MDRRRFLSTTVAGILAAPLAAEAQQKGKLWKIGALWTSAASSPVSSRTVLRQALRELGYVEGRTLLSKSGSQKICQSVSATSRTGSSRPDPTSSSLRALLSAKAFKERTSTIPIVIVLVCDPVGTGLISSLARPGGNVTGLTQICPELNSKRLQIMKEALPRLSRVAVLWDSMGPAAPADDYGRRATEDAGRKLGLELQVMAVRSPNDFSAAFDAAVTGRADGLVLLPSPIFRWNLRPLAELALQHRLPAMYLSREFVDSGGLISYGPSLPETYRHVATYVDKILKGAKTCRSPRRAADKIRVGHQPQDRQALGLTIPPSLLLRADQVIG